MRSSLFIGLILGVTVACAGQAETETPPEESLRVIATGSHAQEFLSAEESDPRNLGWMQGFPPPADKRLSAADGSFFRFPALRWGVMHMREFLPTIRVSRGLSGPTPLSYAFDEGIDAVEFTPWGQDETMT